TTPHIASQELPRKLLISSHETGDNAIIADYCITSPITVICYPIATPNRAEDESGESISDHGMSRAGQASRGLSIREQENAVAEADREDRRERQAAGIRPDRILGRGASRLRAARHRQGRQELDRALP